MALATTTLSSAVTASDNSIVVASATSFAAGRLVRIDGEWMQVGQTYLTGTTIPVLRGRDGSTTSAHVSGANVTHGTAADFAVPPTGLSEAVTVPNALSVTTTSYGAAGAIAFGAAQLTIAIVNGTGALAMTLANPTKDQDGYLVLIVGNGKAAHTVTYTAGFGNAGASYDVATFSANGQNAILAIAANGIWVLLSPMTGTLTSAVPAIA